MISGEDFGRLRSGLPVGRHNTVGVEIVIVRELTVVATIGKEFEFSFGACELAKVKLDHSGLVDIWSREGNVDGLDVAVEGPVAVLSVMSNPNWERGRFDRATVFFAGEDLAIDRQC